MIFVTVGTHEQQFNRLVKYMDEFAKSISEAVVMQTGYSTYEPKNCKWQTMFSYKEMDQSIKNAHIVITHGGPSSFIAPLQSGKTPIVVPRRKEFDEHVNNHQILFCRQIAERMGTIILVEDVEELPNIIEKYDELVKEKTAKCYSNNDVFCKELALIVKNLF